MLPQLLVWYRNDFATEWNQTGLPYEALLHLLPTHMPSAAAQDLRTLLETLTLETQGTIHALYLNLNQIHVSLIFIAAEIVG